MDLNSRNGGVWKTEVIIFLESFFDVFSIWCEKRFEKTYLRKHINTHLLGKGHTEIFDYISDEKTKTKR